MASSSVLPSYAITPEQKAAQASYLKIAARFRESVLAKKRKQITATADDFRADLRKFGFTAEDFDVDEYLQGRLGGGSKSMQDTNSCVAYLLLLKEYVSAQLHQKYYASLPSFIRTGRLCRTVESELLSVAVHLRELSHALTEMSKITFLDDSSTGDTEAGSPSAALVLSPRHRRSTSLSHTFSSSDWQALSTPLMAMNTHVFDIFAAISERNLALAVNRFLALCKGNIAQETPEGKGKTRNLGPATETNSSLEQHASPQLDEYQISEIEDLLAAAIVREIQSHQSVPLIDANVSLLISLGRTFTGSEWFLQSRTMLLSRAMKRLPVVVDAIEYIRRAASLFFACVRAVVTKYREVFQERLLAPLVRWVVLEVDSFVGTMATQLAQIDKVTSKKQTIEHIMACCRHLETAIGLPLSHRQADFRLTGRGFQGAQAAQNFPGHTWGTTQNSQRQA